MITIEPARKKLERIWRDAWRPPDRRPPWAWCEDHITSIPYSPIPGRFRSANSPWMREPMEALVDPKIRIVSIIAAIQSGKTSVGELGLAHIIANHPGPTLWLDQTDDDAKDQSESRLQKLFDECPPVKALYPANRHKRRNTTIHFANGMTLWVLGAHNKTNLQRRSIRWLICDETWRYPTGHMAEAEARVTAFGWLGKCLFMSQGGEEDDDTHRKYRNHRHARVDVCLPALPPPPAVEMGAGRMEQGRPRRVRRVGFPAGPRHHHHALRVVQPLLRGQRPDAPRTQPHRALRRHQPERAQGKRRIPLERASAP